MKKIKNLLLSTIVFALAIGMVSCTKTKKTTSDGIEYTYIKEGKESPNNGDYVLYNLIVKTDSDSTFISTYDQMAPAYLMYNDSAKGSSGMEEIFLGLKKGDSIAFESPAVKIFGELNMPPFIKGDGKIKIQIGVVDVLDEDGIQAYFLALQDAQEKKQKDLSVKQLEEDVKIIEEYVAENNLNAIKTESGLFYVIEEEGSGEQITSGQSASVHYAGYLLDGTLFDTSVKEKAQAAGLYNAERDKNGGYASFDLNVGVGLVIPGWDEGLLLLKKGSKAKFIIPSTLAYGERGSGAVIKPNSVLVFDIDVIEVN